MIERIILVALLSATVALAFFALRALHVRKMRPHVSDAETLPTLLYFHADSCAVCPTQGRVVDQLAAQWHERLRIERIDAEREPERAAQYRVFTLPTTILVDGGGQVRQVNYGLTDANRLTRQVAALSVSHEEQEVLRVQVVESAPSL